MPEERCKRCGFTLHAHEILDKSLVSTWDTGYPCGGAKKFILTPVTPIENKISKIHSFLSKKVKITLELID